MNESAYPIGTPGEPWGEAEKSQWLEAQSIQRSYAELVQAPLDALAGQSAAPWQRRQYGALSYDTSRYPLWLFESANWSPDLPAVLITGGVHGYETSGVIVFFRQFDQCIGKVHLLLRSRFKTRDVTQNK